MKDLLFLKNGNGRLFSDFGVREVGDCGVETKSTTSAEQIFDLRSGAERAAVEIS